MRFPDSLKNLSIGLLILVGFAACGTENSVKPTAQNSDTADTPNFARQATAGADTFATNCAACHGANLEGTTLGPLLSGSSFLQRWGAQNPSLLLNNIQANMPPGGNESLRSEDYLDITAHILSVNGVDSVVAALTPSTDFTIADNVSRIAAQKQRSEPESPQGLTVAGNVDDFATVLPRSIPSADLGRALPAAHMHAKLGSRLLRAARLRQARWHVCQRHGPDGSP